MCAYVIFCLVDFSIHGSLIQFQNLHQLSKSGVSNFFLQKRQIVYILGFVAHIKFLLHIFFQPFKNVKTLCSSQAGKNQALRWSWTSGCNLPTPGLNLLERHSDVSDSLSISQSRRRFSHWFSTCSNLDRLPSMSNVQLSPFAPLSPYPEDSLLLSSAHDRSDALLHVLVPWLNGECQFPLAWGPVSMVDSCTATLLWHSLLARSLSTNSILIGPGLSSDVWCWSPPSTHQDIITLQVWGTTWTCVIYLFL